MENDLTVKYYTKHRYGAGHTKKKYIWQIEKKTQETVEEYTSDPRLMDFYFVTFDGRTSQSSVSVMSRLLSCV